MSPSQLQQGESHRQYVFADFVLDMERGCLRRGEQEIPLQPKAFEVLTYLIERHGRLVTKTELSDAIWGETAVTDNSLSQCVMQIRRALADDSQQIIRTITRRGYMFSAPLAARELPRSLQAVQVASRAPASRYRQLLTAALTVVILALGAAAVLYRPVSSGKTSEPVYTQITNFPDSAAGPVLSPDGRMLAFFRDSGAFATQGPVYIKILPDGEAVRLTDDPRNKYGLAFSPDGSQIAYTAWEQNARYQWQTFTVPVLGGEPRLMFANAAGLTWLDKDHLLYSEIRTGLHMGVVTSGLTRADRREIYFPQHERRMAHYSYASPDRKWLLLAEMEPEWLPCRIVPFEGRSPGREVGPRGPCTAAGWSPDGKWMYFGVLINGAHHIWRQRFPDGQPEQITFGPAEEEGLAIAPDGRSLITSVGVRQSAVWVHDSRGERAISPEGYAPSNYLTLAAPLFSRDGRQLYYLLSRQSPGAPNELWRTDLASNASECVVRGFAIEEFDISDATGEVVFSSKRSGERSQIWLMPLDRSAPPRRLADSGESSPRFGPPNTVWFRYSDGKADYAGQINKDGGGRHPVTSHPISSVISASPDGQWLIAMAPGRDRTAIDTVGIGADGSIRLIGRGRIPVVWTRDQKFVCVGVNGGGTVAIPVRKGDFPELPAGAINSVQEALAIPGSRLMNGYDISPGPDPSIFAYVKITPHRNLFRISLQ